MNSENNRELERKFRILKPSKEDVEKNIKKHLALADCVGLPDCQTLKTSQCRTLDHYFPMPGGNRTLRLRDSWGTNSLGYSEQLQEITLKINDKATIEDRFELNFTFNTKDLKDAHKLLTLLQGKPTLIIDKTETIFFLKDKTVISLSHIANDSALYLEIESANLTDLQYYENMILHSHGSPIVTKLESSSFFDTYNKLK